MGVPTITFTTTIDRTTGKVYLTDTTNYLAAGVPINTNPTAAQGYVQLLIDTGSGPQSYYNNLLALNPPDVEPDSGVMIWANSALIPYPTTTTGEPVAGQYTIRYRVVGFFEVLAIPFPFDVTVEQSYDYTLNDPVICLDTQVVCATSTITSTDDTVYDIPNGTVTSITRAHTLYPPPASGQSNLGPANLVTLTYTPIYTTTWTAECISTVTYTMNDGLIVIVEYSGVKEFAVSCDTSLSKIICCLTNIQNEYEALECSNPTKAQLFKTNKLDPTLQHLVLYLAAQSVGNTNKMAAEYAEIIEASGCSEDCNCNGNAPAPVTPQTGGPAITYVVDSLLNTIQVTTVTGPNTVTYYVDIDPAILAVINSLGTTTVTTNTPLYLNVTQVGVAPNYIYQVDFNSANVLNYSSHLYVRFALDYNNAAPGNNYYDVTAVLCSIQGEDVTFKKFVNHQYFFGQTSPNQAGNFAILRYYNFLKALYPYVASSNLMRVHNVANGVVSDIKDMEAELFWFDDASATGDLYIRLYNTATGQPYTLADLFSLNGTNKIYLTLSINLQ
jgi:hypothetical protein